MKTDSRLEPKSGDVVVPQTELSEQPEEQRAISPPEPTAQILLPDTPKVTEKKSPPVNPGSLFIGILFQLGAPCKFVPCKIVGANGNPGSALPTAQPSLLLSKTMDSRSFVVVPALTGPFQVPPVK